MTPTDLKIVAFYSPEQVAQIFGQFHRDDVQRKERDRDGSVKRNPDSSVIMVTVHRKGDPDSRWVYRHSADRHGFLYRAARRHPGARTLLFDRAEIDRIVAEFRPPDEG